MLINSQNLIVSNTIKIALLFAIIISYGCGAGFIRNKEAREDAAELEAALSAQSNIHHQLVAVTETQPVTAVKHSDDAADDPAIWYNSKSPSKSKIIGSNKTAGIHIYDLKGTELQFVPCGRINNVDVRQDVDLGIGPVSIVVGSNRTGNTITIFQLDDEGLIIEKTRSDLRLGKRFKPYGFCLYHGLDNVLYLFVNAKTGDIDQYKISQSKNGDFVGQKVRSLQLDTQVEGMVADDDNQLLFVGEEQNAIFQFGAEPNGNAKPRKIGGSSAAQNPKIRYDIEGLALLSSQYLVASIQGSFSYAIFDIPNDQYLTSFKIVDGNIDGVEETDGIEILTAPLGKKFPNGVLVVQDGYNEDKEGNPENQNFKLIDLSGLYKILDLENKELDTAME